ncbi:MAG: glucosamine-6-phosphate deaminase [Pseudomonadota bacterium]
MRVVIQETPAGVANYAADLFARQLEEKPDSVLGLATGSTPVRLYKLLIERYERGEISFRRASTFNLDEYLGLDGDHPQSYRRFMNREFFEYIDIDRHRTHVPDGMALDPRKAALDYERRLSDAGGVDLQLLGIGANGHIGFNEPYSSLGSRTRVKTLTRQTIADNARFFANERFQPHLSLTMGIATILDARRIVLLATGRSKAAAVKRTIEGAVTAKCPSSALQLHPAVTVLIDTEAAGQLEDPDFFRHIEKEDQALPRSPDA